ncbi:MAG: nuclear transport factor 2 family protein [Xanthobacteraceae bacterium]|nr:nuclear transport factor 2 family protein [Xanthobacteraceae bacterium]
MTVQLPAPLDIYFTSENAHDPGGIDRCFAPNATVRDEKRTIAGRAAIRNWRTETGERYRHTVEPLAWDERDGKIIVTARISGQFPGSPINLDHIFVVEAGMIESLEIR